MMLKTLALATSALALLAVTNPAFAADFSSDFMLPARSHVVRYDDLDVTHAQGAQALLARIKSAAKLVCGPPRELGGLVSQSAFDACVESATARAVASTDNRLISQLFIGQPNVSVAERD